MKTFEQFMNEGADDKDPYWLLFEVNKVVNQAVLDAVEYGYKKAQEQADQEITKLKKMVFDMQNAAIEMAENQKSLEYWNRFILDKVTLDDEHDMGIDRLYPMALDIVYEKIQHNLIDDVSFDVVLVKVSRISFGKRYEYLVVRKEI